MMGLQTDREYLPDKLFRIELGASLESMHGLLNVADGVEPDRLQIVVEIRITIEASIAHLSNLKTELPR